MLEMLFPAGLQFCGALPCHSVAAVDVNNQAMAWPQVGTMMHGMLNQTDSDASGSEYKHWTGAYRSEYVLV